MEGLPVFGGVAQAADGFYMFGGGITHVVFPAITWIILRQGPHAFVPVGFCEYGCGCDGCVGGIAMDDGKIVFAAVARERTETVAVYQKEFGLDA